MSGRWQKMVSGKNILLRSGPVLSQKHLLQLHRHKHDGRRTQHGQQFVERQGSGFKNRVQERNVNSRQLQHKSQRDGPEQRKIGQQTLPEQRLRFGANRQHVSHLAEAKHGEYHRLPMFVA